MQYSLMGNCNIKFKEAMRSAMPELFDKKVRNSLFYCNVLSHYGHIISHTCVNLCKYLTVARKMKKLTKFFD